MYVVCRDHLERALDEFVETYEMPPDVYELDRVQFTAWEAPAACYFCEEPPRYLVV